MKFRCPLIIVLTLACLVAPLGFTSSAFACPPPHVIEYMQAGLSDKYPMGGGVLVAEEDDGLGNWMTCRDYDGTLVNVSHRIEGPGLLNLWDTMTVVRITVDGKEVAYGSYSQRSWDMMHDNTPPSVTLARYPIALCLIPVALICWAVIYLLVRKGEK